MPANREVTLRSKIIQGLICAACGVFFVYGLYDMHYCGKFNHASEECRHMREHLPSTEVFIGMALTFFAFGFVEAGKTMAEAFGRKENDK
jgi:hypothetical protein